MCHTFYPAQDKMPMHACFAMPYFNAYLKCSLGSTLSSCFPQSGMAHWRSRVGKNRYMILEPNTGILDHLIKAFIFFGLHPSMFISFKCWNKWVGLSCVDHQPQLSWVWYMVREIATETQEPFNWENTEWSFRMATAWQRKPMYDPTSFFRKLQYIVPLHHQNTCI